RWAWTPCRRPRRRSRRARCARWPSPANTACRSCRTCRPSSKAACPASRWWAGTGWWRRLARRRRCWTR
ncbi:hypothetical protein MyNCGM683_35910, partial [Achromobacter xylosoxidans]